MHTTNVMFLGSRDVVKLGVRTSRCTYIIEVAYGDTLFELMYVGGGGGSRSTIKNMGLSHYMWQIFVRGSRGNFSIKVSITVNGLNMEYRCKFVEVDRAGVWSSEKKCWC